MKTILLGISGSIAAYKSADITSQLIKKGYQVDIAMTKNSTHFITPLTLQALSKQPVHIEVIAENDPQHITHIDLAKRADLFIIAPATANVIAKLAYGIADDMVTTVALALPEETPKLIAPAMNTQMYQHPTVEQNLQKLQTFGYEIIDPRSSLLACGDLGKGALANVDMIIQEIEKKLTSRS